MFYLLKMLVSMFVTIMAVNIAYPRVLRFALQKNLVDNPEARKIHKHATPVMGGLPVCIGLLAGIMTAMGMSTFLGIPYHEPVLALICALMLLFFMGLLDDMLGLKASHRFVFEILIVLTMIFATGQCVDSFHGLWGMNSLNWWFAVPLTVVAVVGIINAINMIDGVNGLSSSLCILFNLYFGFAFLISKNYTNANLNLIMASALLPFLIHNVVGLKSKMFLGDSGTMIMGTLLSWDVIQMLSVDFNNESTLDESEVGLVALSFAILALPVLDTIRVMFLRIKRGVSPFSADRSHLHHVLMNYSYSHSITTIIELIIAILVVLCWFCSYLLGASVDLQLYVSVIASFVFVWGSYAFLKWKESYQFGIGWRLRELFVKMRQGDKNWWLKLQQFVDRGA